MYPSRSSTSAIALIPLPPTPTQWIAFVRPSTRYSAAPAQAPTADEREGAIDDDARRVRPRQTARRRGHALRAGPGHAPAREMRTAKRVARQLALIDHFGGARARQHLRVLPLVIVGRRRQRHENRRRGLPR